MILLPVYKILKQRLNANQNLTAKEISWFLSQYDQVEDNHWHVDSGIYIEFRPVTIETKGHNYQQGQLEVIFHYAQYCVYDDDQRITDQALDHMDQIDVLNQELQGAEAYLSEIPQFSHLQNTQDDFEVFNQFDLRELEPDHNFRNVMVTRLRYTCAAFDKGNVKFRNWNQVSVNPNVGN